MFIHSENTSEIADKIAKHIAKRSALINIAEGTSIDIKALIGELNKRDVKFIGGIFPRVIHKNKIYDEGIVINTLVNVVYLSLVKNISEKKFKIPTFNFKKDTHYSLLTYVDGLTSNISNYLSQLYEKYGMQTNYIGGGAGSLTLEQKPCVFTKEGIFMDAAVICLMQVKSSIGVRHGWEKLEGPYIVTKVRNNNTIKEINWETAFSIYKPIIEADCGIKFNEHNFFELAKGYPFGIVKSGGECVIRDPITYTKDDGLICVGELEENTLINIMKGDKSTLINAAKKAAEDSLKNTTNPKKAIIIDCISRVLFLKDDFEEELNIIIDTLQKSYPDISVGGALTLGEISSFGEGYLEFYNKTVVVSLFE